MRQRWPALRFTIPWAVVVDLITVTLDNKTMAKFLKKPTNEYDQELAAKGLRRAQELADMVAFDTGKKDSEGNPIFTFGGVWREKIVPIDNVKSVKGKPRMQVESASKLKGKQYQFKKAPRSGSKLSAAVGIVQRLGKDDKPACIESIAEVMGVTKGNASIYYAKAKALIEAGLSA